MPRRSRFVLPEVAHHVTQRGNNRQSVFFSDDDRSLYLDLLTRHAARHHTHVLGYCLMTNHVHLVVIPERADSLARTLGRTHSEYALALNHSNQRSGHLWQNRFYSCPLDAAHLEEVLRYVDLNPVRAGLAAAARDWPWSSARRHCAEAAVDTVLDCDWIARVGGWGPRRMARKFGERDARRELDRCAARDPNGTTPRLARVCDDSRAAGRSTAAGIGARTSEGAGGARGAAGNAGLVVCRERRMRAKEQEKCVCPLFSLKATDLISMLEMDRPPVFLTPAIRLL
jgi:putative transposase